MTRPGTFGTIVVVAAALSAGCGTGETPPASLEETPIERVVPAPGLDPVLPDPPPAPPVDPLEPPELAGLPADTVRGWTGPGGQPFEVILRTPGSASYLHRQIGRETFALPARTSDLTLTQYPCTSCHQGAVASGDLPVDRHPDVRTIHPATAECTTCHASTSVDRLVVAGSEPVSLNHAYQLCAQCHFSETDAWAAGIHGKRLDGWSGRRVVMNCADCHDPHRPQIEPRIPYPGPRLP